MRPSFYHRVSHLFHQRNKFSSINFSAASVLSEGMYERPTPILFLCGEGLTVSCWEPYASLLSKRGFCGTILPLDSSSRNIKQVHRTVEEAIKRSGFWPPIVIAHSLSTFIAQKYLESFSMGTVHKKN